MLLICPVQNSIEWIEIIFQSRTSVTCSVCKDSPSTLSPTPLPLPPFPYAIANRTIFQITRSLLAKGLKPHPFMREWNKPGNGPMKGQTTKWKMRKGSEGIRDQHSLANFMGLRLAQMPNANSLDLYTESPSHKMNWPEGEKMPIFATWHSMSKFPSKVVI